MKISKCKKELARIISEHGGWRDGANFSAQDKDGEVFHYEEKPTLRSGRTVWDHRGCIGHGEFSCEKLPNWHQTILSREEYFFLYQEQGLEDALNEDFPDSDGWIEWKGGECPVEKGTLVDVIWMDGRERTGVKALQLGGAGHRFWVADGMVNDIIAYRLHKPEQSTVETRLADAVDIVKAAAPALMSDEMKFTGDEVMGEIKPTLDRLLQDWRNADDFAKRKQAEADEAAAMRDERWQAVQDHAGEFNVTVGRCDGMVDESELVITDWRNLLVGDIVEIVGSENERWLRFKGVELFVSRT